MTPTAWILIGLVIAATTAAPFALIAIARRSCAGRGAPRRPPPANTERAPDSPQAAAACRTLPAPATAPAAQPDAAPGPSATPPFILAENLPPEGRPAPDPGARKGPTPESDARCPT